MTAIKEYSRSGKYPLSTYIGFVVGMIICIFAWFFPMQAYALSAESMRAVADAIESAPTDGSTTEIVLSNDIENTEGISSITVPEGAAIKLSGNYRLGGGLTDRPDHALKIIVPQGSSVTLAETSLESVVFEVQGNFAMESGSITQAHITDTAVVHVNGGSFTMTGGRIADNNITLSHPFALATDVSAVTVRAGGSFVLDGGVIAHNNNGRTGSPWFAPAGGVSIYDPGTTFTMNSGSIEHNFSKDISLAGGLTIMNGAEFVMNGGTFEGNVGNYGGGIAVFPTGVLTMNGGEIIANEARRQGGNGTSYGGGVYVQSNFATFNGGTFTRNVAQYGGAIYVTGDENTSYEAHFNDVLITNNHATNYPGTGFSNASHGPLGGGLYFCLSGSGEVRLSRGVAVFDNDAQYTGTEDRSASGQDISFALNRYGSPYSFWAENTMLGGGENVLYRDGGVEGNIGTIPDVPRYSADTPGERLENLQDIVVERGFGAINVVSDPAKQLARQMGRLVITDNTALWGGGIGVNGHAVFGTNEKPYRLVVKKAWKDVPSEDRPDQITGHVRIGGYRVYDFTLSEENNWEEEVATIPNPQTLIDKDGNLLKVTVEEENAEDYAVSIDSVDNGQDRITFTITNALAPEEPTDPHKPNQPSKPNNPPHPHDPIQPNVPDQPNQPVPNKPYQPVVPTPPITPDNPSEPGVQVAVNSHETLARTGDEMPALPVAIVLGAAGIMGLIAFMRVKQV